MNDGNVSLYLDIYYNGVRKYEFLKLYLVKETTKQDREKNKTTLALANSIKAKRIIELQSGALDVTLKKTDVVRFTDYYDSVQKIVPSRINSVWRTIKNLILEYSRNDEILLKSINHDFVSGFIQYLTEKKLKEGTKHTYLATFKCFLNQAVRDGYLNGNVLNNIRQFKESEAKRTYLTEDELRMLVQTKCRIEEVKNAFLFSCLTGLRISDVRNLKWGDVAEENGYTRITFKQKKTHWQEYLDINKQAVLLMGERKKDEDYVFDLPYHSNKINYNLKLWAKKAGVSKHVTFHVARHTFATIMLSKGVDLYTVSKLVGHRDISTTQIYAKVMDKDKRNAVDKLPDIF